MIDACLSSFQSFQVIKYEQSLELIKSLRREIIPHINNMIKTHSNEENKIISNLKLENKKLNEYFEKINKVKDKYFENKEDWEISIEKEQESSLQHQILTKKMEESKIVLKNSIEDFNTCIEEYLKISEKTDSYFYNQDNSKLDLIKDSLVKYFIYEISCLRNLQYDSDRITKKLENISLLNENFLIKELSKFKEISKIDFASLINFSSDKNKSKKKTESNEDGWKNIVDKWSNYAKRNLNFLNKDKKDNFNDDPNAMFIYIETFFINSCKGLEHDSNTFQNIKEIIKKKQFQQAYSMSLETFRNYLRNPLTDSQYNYLMKCLLLFLNEFLEQKNIDLIKKTISFSKYFYKYRVSFEIKNRSMIPKQEEKIFLFSDIKNVFSYTQTEYWLTEAHNKINNILQKFNENKENDEVLKSQLISEIEYIYHEMNLVNFSRENVNSVLSSIRNNFFNGENSQFSVIFNETLAEYFNNKINLLNEQISNKENYSKIIQPKRKIFEDNLTSNISNEIDDVFKLQKEPIISEISTDLI